MITIGHRGCKNEVPENTLRAIEYAASYVDVIEVDVRECRSGELVCFHDDDLGEKTGYRGAVSETAWETIRDLRVEGSDATVPRFADVLDQWPENVGLNVDVKGTGILDDVLDLLDGSSVDGSVVVSIERSVLSELPSDPGPMVGLSFSRAPEENVDVATSHGLDYVHVSYPLCFETDVVDRAHDAELNVDAWSVDDRTTLTRLERAGVDAATINSCDIV